MRRVGVACLLVFAWACGDGKGGGAPDLAPAGLVVETACGDAIADVYGDPGPLPAERGAIVRCALDRELSAAEVAALLAPDARFTATAPTSGARVYRVLYRTERGDSASTAATSSALLLLPTVPRAPSLPVLVLSHGSRGQGGDCAPSKRSPNASTVEPDFTIFAYPLVGYGYAVLAPDLPGYANYGAAGNPPSVYGGATDVGKATLDGARALKRLIPTATSDQVALVGFSQGGQTTLSALALADSYAPELHLAAVGLFAPLWLPQRTWGGILGLAGAFPISTSAGANAVSIMYHYTHGELLDGAGHGLDMFRADKRTGVKAFMDSCWGQNDWATLRALGNDATDIFDPAFTQAVSRKAIGFDATCPTSDATAQALCEKWMARYTADRPHLTSATARAVPMSLVWGAKDSTIPYDRITCALDRLKADHVSLSPLCVVPSVDHGGAVGARIDWMADWLAARTLGGAEPGACGGDASAIVDGNGMPAMCNPLPPND